MDENKIVMTRTLEAPIETVWDAFTKPENLMQWKAPEGMSTPNAEVDLRIGGKYSITMAGGYAGPTGEVMVTGVYKQIEKPTTLIFTWQWIGQKEKTQVSVLLKKHADNKTELTLIHEGFETIDSRNNHSVGWEGTLKKLTEFLK
jgi:uncharacterized protein YndB with AHSA1/START domain